MKFNRLVTMSLTLCTVIVLTACNTMEGFGQDMKNAGQSIENAASKHTGN